MSVRQNELAASDNAQPRTLSILLQHEIIIPLILFAGFLSLTLPGISWGAPSTWHPDEIVVQSIKALHGELRFDETNFDYPSLPKYAMFFLGRVVLASGGTDGDILVASRILSAVFAGLTIVLTYLITRRAGASIPIAALSGLLLLGVSEMQHNGRFAHNDTYITFFVTLTVLFLFNHRLTNHRGWLYAAFLAVGMAASSKYNGIALLLAPVALFLISEGNSIRRGPLRIIETLFIGGALTFLGYAAGTPKALFWMSYYFKRMIPSLLRQGSYGRQPDSVRGLLGQYGSFADGIGLPLFILFAAALVWAIYRLVKSSTAESGNHPRADIPGILLLAILALDLPIMLSYNYPTRFFLPMMPLFAVLGALFVGDVYRTLRQNGYGSLLRIAPVVLGVILLFSLARNLSVMSLFLHDARIPASEYMKTLASGASLEHTYYPPTIPRDRFEREHNYPIHFVKILGEELPTSPKYVFNAGESGLDERHTTYLVIDSFTYDRFSDPYICETMKVECDFFKQLETGSSAHYRQIAEFSYRLPPYLPAMRIAFVNPDIRVYERIP